jgi:hypothetical protein
VALFNLNQKMQQRLVNAVELGHKPEFFQETFTPKVGGGRWARERLGVAVSCSCGWRSSRGYAKKEGAVWAFFWHLEEVLDGVRRSPSDLEP